MDIAKKLIDVAARAGADAVKFQKRTPEISTPEHMRDVSRETPWGVMSYLDYRRRVEFGRDEYVGDRRPRPRCLGLDWFASPWDVPSVAFLEDLGVVAHKVASASLTDTELLVALHETGKPVILSTGMSTIEQIDRALDTLGTDRVVLMHATSTYPLEPEEANLRVIATLRDRYPRCARGLLGARARTPDLARRRGHRRRGRRTPHHARSHHVGSDHAASLEPTGLEHLVRDIRVIERATETGSMRVFDSERAPMAKLRRISV